MRVKMNERIRPLFVALILVLFLIGVLPHGASATTLSWGLFPDSQTVILGQPFQVDLVVSGLGDGVPPSLEGFDVDITFSEELTIDHSSVIFGTSLGDPDDASQTSTTASLIGPGVLFLREDSFLASSALDAIQGSSFTLATMSFTASEVSTFSLWGDDFSGGLFLTNDTTEKPGINGAYVTVTPVPEPATIILLGTGLIGIVGYRRNKFQKK
jgi:hypothetical protein